MSDHELRELSTQLVRGSIDERCAVLSALSGLAELAQSEQGLGSVVQALKELLTQLSARPHLDEAEIDMLSQALRLLDQVTKTDEDGGYSHAFCGPTVLCLVRETLPQLARDVDTLTVTLSVLRRLGGQYPLSMLRSQILHDLLRDERLWSATGSSAMRQSLVAIIVACAHRMQSREDAALLLMIVPSLRRIAHVPSLAALLSRGGQTSSSPALHADEATAALASSSALCTPSSQVRRRSGSGEVGGDVATALLSSAGAGDASRGASPSRVSSSRQLARPSGSAAGLRGAGAAALASVSALAPATDSPPELFVRELALRALCVIMTRLIDMSNVPPCPADTAKHLVRQRHREARRAAAAAALAAAARGESTAAAAPSRAASVAEPASTDAPMPALEADGVATVSAAPAAAAAEASSESTAAPPSDVADASAKPPLLLESSGSASNSASGAASSAGIEDAPSFSAGGEAAAPCTSVSVADSRLPIAFGGEAKQSDSGSSSDKGSASTAAAAATAADAASTGASVADAASSASSAAATAPAGPVATPDASAAAASAAAAAAAAAASASRSSGSTHTVDREIEADAAAAISVGLHGRSAARRNHHGRAAPAPGETGGPPAAEAWKTRREAAASASKSGSGSGNGSGSSAGGSSDWPRRGAAHLLQVHKLQRLFAAALVAATTIVPVPEALLPPPAASAGASPIPAPMPLATSASGSSSLSSASLRLQSARRLDGRREGLQLQMQQALLPLSLPTLRIVVRSLTAGAAFWRFQAAVPLLLAASRPIKSQSSSSRHATTDSATKAVTTSAAAAAVIPAPTSASAAEAFPAASAAAKPEAEAADAPQDEHDSRGTSPERSSQPSRAGSAARDAASAPSPFPKGFLAPAEAAALHAAVLRLLAAAPLALPSLASPEERGEALELADDACVLLLDAAREADGGAAAVHLS